MIDVEQLVKWYGPTCAVDHISFHIPKGLIVGFLGPNGAGKSTTLRILTGYIPPSQGRTTIAGYDGLTQAEMTRKLVGYLPENNPLYPEMRVQEYLDYRGKLFSMDRTKRRERTGYVIDRCGLGQASKRLIGHLSRGNRQRVGLAQALLHNPPVLILDEPTAGLDPNQLTAFRSLMLELKGEHTILLSTHILPEIERIADHAIIIASGKIAAEGKIQELQQRLSQNSPLVVEAKAPAEAMRTALMTIPGVVQVTLESPEPQWSRAIIMQQPGTDLRESISHLLSQHHWPIREMRSQTPGLEQFFIQITAQQSQAVA